MKEVESFYPLSPMQQGMLFHSLAEPQSGMYVELSHVELTGGLDVDNFIKAWQKVVDHHPILRTSFVWEGLKEPVQVVRQKVSLPFDKLDWRGKPASEQKQQLDELLQSARQKGFDLTQPPLMRFMIVQTGAQAFHLIWIHHHILLDGWSVPLLLQEALSCYAAYTTGMEPTLVASRPYKDYIVWLRRKNLAESEVYWKQKLAGFSAPTPLVVTGLVKNDLSPEPDFVEDEVDLPANLTTRLQEFARRNGLTLNTLVQAAWAILLSRYSGEEDILYGCTVSGRPPELPGAETMIGLFINTLPVRVNTSPEQSLLPFLKELQTQQAEIRQYEYTPLMQIQNWSQVPKGKPLFDSIVVFENFPISQLNSGTTQGIRIQGGQSASHTNLPLTIVAAPGAELTLKISYNRHLFDPATIRRMSSHLQTLLSNMPVFANQPLARLPILPELERKILLEDWVDRVAEAGGQLSQTDQSDEKVTRPLCIHEWFESRVRQSPDSIAVTFGAQFLTYQELNCRANLLANYLIHLGVGPESLVGLYMERSLDLVVAILGILKAGGAYVPLDPTYPADRVAYIIDDYSKYSPGLVSEQNQGEVNPSPASILITQQSKLADLPPIQAHSVCLDTEWEQIASTPAYLPAPQMQPAKLAASSDPISGVKPENLAYVIYTSGSTGKPKGVMVTHANVVRLFHMTDAWYHFDSRDVWTLFHSYAFDFSVWEIWGAFFYGGRLVVVPYLTSRSPEDFYQLLCKEGVTVLNQTPSAFRQLIRAEEYLGVSSDLALRYVIFGGEALELQSLKPWFNRHGDQRPQLINMYGITETTVHVTYRPIFLKDLELAPGSVIGRAIPDLQVYILDAFQNPAPIGVPGELYVGGAGVARGYLNRPELTAQKFITGLFDQPGNSNASHLPAIYRSGDLARYLPDGDIEYLGRIDFQVKIRGYRIELGEIESAIARYPGVREVVVLVSEEKNPAGESNKQLLAFLVMQPGDGYSEQIDSSDLRRFLAVSLPDYMLPAAFIVLPTFPLTNNGKIDRRALLAQANLEKERTGQGKVMVEPRTPQEATVAKIWSQLLGVPAISITDHFYELGGDSILSIQFLSRARQAGLEFTYRQLFEHPVLKDLVASISATELADGKVEFTAGKIPLTPIQHWFFTHHREHPEQFNTSIMVKLGIELNPDTLSETLRQVLLQHAALRLKFSPSASQPENAEDWQAEINQSYDEQLPFETVNLVDLNPEQALKQIQTLANQAQNSFDLQTGPLLRMIYFRTASNFPGRLLFIFHHLVFDGVSVRIFMEDFLTAYFQILGGKPVQLLEEKTTYGEWANRMVKAVEADVFQAEAEYWSSQGANPVEGLPVDYPDGENTYGSTEIETVFLDEKATNQLIHQLPKVYGVRLHTILLTAWLRSLAPWVGSHSFYIEMEGHGREVVSGTPLADVDLSRTIGWFTSIFPVRFELPGDLSLADQFKQIEAQVQAIPHNGLGYGMLRYLSADAAVQQKLAGLPAPELNFNYLGIFDQSGVEVEGDSFSPLQNADVPTLFEISDEPVGAEQDPHTRRSAKIYVVATISGRSLGVRWLYSCGLHKAETIKRLAENYLSEINRMLMAPE